MKRSIVRPVLARLGFYVIVVLLVAAVRQYEHYMDARALTKYDGAVAAVSPTPDPDKEARPFLDMNQLLTTLGTGLLGALAFFLINGHGRRRLQDLLPAFGSAVCVGISIYFGFVGHQHLIALVNYGSFTPYDPYEWPPRTQFLTFLLGVFFFADFAFHDLRQEDPRERLQKVAGD